MTVKQFCIRHRITAEGHMVDHNPNVDGGGNMDHWSVKLTRKGAERRTMTVPFSMGQALCREPTAEDVLSCLAIDAAGVENAPGFEEWAEEYGFDPDSRRAERTFRAVEKQTRKLRQFLGERLFEELLAAEE